MGALLQAVGKLGEAKPPYEEAMQGKRETMGDRHPDTLASINNLGTLLRPWASWRRRGRCTRSRCRRAGRRWATATRARWPRSTTWACCYRRWASWRRRGRCTRRRCRHSGRRWATATRARWPRSTTWACCYRRWASWRRRGRCSRSRCRRGDAGRPPPEYAGLDQQHGRATEEDGQGGEGKAVVRGGPAGGEGDAGRPPPEHADLHGRAAVCHGHAGRGQAAVQGSAAGKKRDAGRPPPGHPGLD
eukprot:scaffold40515_cov61-Phaeocystis_antarctica.AAC.1